LCQTLISLDTSATLNGRLLTQTAATLNGNNVVEPNPNVSTSEGEIPYAVLETNYPNPFNPSTTIRFEMKDKENGSLTIFNMKGQKVKTLINAQLEVGQYSVIWNGTDENSNQVTSGLYFYKLEAGGRYTSTKKMILMK